MPTHPATELTTHAAFVRRLAFHLLRDDAAADDAAQETMARALARPPRPGPRISAWFAMVLRNVIRRDLRGEGRRTRRERVAARFESVRGPDHMVARAELLSRVADAVAQLDSTQKEIVLLRYFDDLPPREIARRLGISVDAVHARVRRAHAGLKNLLDDGRGGNVEGWRTALGAAIGVGSGLAARSASAKSVATGGLAAMAVSKTAVGVMGVILAVGLGVTAYFAALSPSPTPSSDGPPADAPLLGASSGDAVELHGRAPTPRSPQDSDVAPSMPSPAGSAPASNSEPSLARRVQDANRELSPRDVVAGVVFGAGDTKDLSIELLPSPQFASDELRVDTRWPARTSLAPDGTFRFASVPVGAFLVRLRGPGAMVRESGLPVPQTEKGNHQQVFPIGNATLEGHVFDRLGSPAIGLDVSVRAETWQILGTAHIARAKSDGQGRYRLEGLVEGSYHVFAILGTDSSGADDYRTEHVTLAANESRRLDLGSATAERTWSGTARFESGTPLRPPSVLVLYMETATSRTAIHVSVDVEGRFEKRVPPGSYALTAWHKLQDGLPLGGSPWSQKLDIGDVDVAGDLTIKGVILSGVVRDARDRSPKAGVAVRILSADGPDPGDKAPKTVSAADGTFRFEAVPSGKWRLATTSSNGAPSAQSTVTVPLFGAGDVSNLELEVRAE